MHLELALQLCTRIVVAVAVIVACGGCGGGNTYPVEGKIVFSDGRPATQLAGGSVQFEAVGKPMSAQGAIQPDASFRLGTEQPGDGAVEGKHRVVIIPPLAADMDNPGPPIIDPRFHSFETSGLDVTVKPEKNDVTLTVERPKR
jgi:hypothetical protein